MYGNGELPFTGLGSLLVTAIALIVAACAIVAGLFMRLVRR